MNRSARVKASREKSSTKRPFSISFLWAAIGRCHSRLAQCHPRQTMWSRELVTGEPSYPPFIWFQIQASWQPRSTTTWCLCALQMTEKENVSLKTDKWSLIRLLRRVHPKGHKHKGCLMAFVIRKMNIIQKKTLSPNGRAQMRERRRNATCWWAWQVGTQVGAKCCGIFFLNGH